MTKIAIVIPIYKKTLSEFEKISLIQCCKILNKFQFFLICSDELSSEEYEDVLNEYNIDYKIKNFEKKFFRSVEDYNQLLLSVSFYKRFKDYDFILMYQLDAYVFRDDLEYWCKKKYDYIGAPWFSGFSRSNNHSKMLNMAGNGGFSLRKIKSFVSVLGHTDNKKNTLLKEFKKAGGNEDIFFSKFAKDINKNFRVAPSKEAMYFSFECQPRRLYKMTSNELPFGCHAWERYDFNFWKSFINLENINFGKENELNLKKLSAMRGNIDRKIGEVKYLKNELSTTKSRLDNMKLELVITQQQITAMQQELDARKMQLNNVYNSREWRMIAKLRRLFKILFPISSVRRKSLTKCINCVKKSVRLFKKIKIFLYIFIKSNYYKLKPKKKRQINKKSKKLVYIDHSYHNKTKSTIFLQKYLKEFFDLEIISDDSWQGKESPDLSFIDDSYLGVIFFQILPPRDILKKIKNDNIIFFPMYDGVSHEYDFWNQYRDLKIVNFSSTLYKKLRKWGFETMYIQYFPKVQDFVPGKKDEVFFWQRLTKINFKIIINLLGRQNIKIHLHKAVDPNQKFVKPLNSEEKKYNITYSKWFDRREEMQEIIKQKAIYIAPREYEGIGQSFLEAMAMGKAVIAVDNPTMNEYIKHGKTGYLFDLQNPQEIDLANIVQIQENAYNYMVNGRKRWKKDRKNIIKFIKKD